MNQPKPIPIDAIVKYGGKTWRIGAVNSSLTERYYWLTRGSNECAILPASQIEQAERHGLVQRHKLADTNAAS